MHGVQETKKIMVRNVSEVALGSIWPEIEADCSTRFDMSSHININSLFRMFFKDLWGSPIHHWISGPSYAY